MSIESTLSGHWTDDQLIDHIYGVGPGDGHLPGCRDCAARLAAMQLSRRNVEAIAAAGDAVNHQMLAAQRRAIYARLSAPTPFFSLRRWASAAAAVLVLGGSLLLYQQKEQRDEANQISDAQLAAEVSNMALESEPRSTAPLQALFEQ